MDLKKAAWLLLLFSLVSFGQTFSSLRGTITDSAGRKIPGIRLVALGPSGIRHETTSDAEGAYAFDRLEPAVYTVRVDASDFKPFSRENVNVAANGATLDVTLDLADLSTTVTVTAQKREEEVATLPLSVDVLGARQIEQGGIDQVEVLTGYIPNFQITDTGGRSAFSFISLRGFVNNSSSVDPSTGVYVDGVPVNDFYTLNQKLFDVERVEVLKGPQGTLYGVNSQAGVINIISKAPTDTFHGTVTGSYGSYNGYETTLSLSGPLIKQQLWIGAAGSMDGRDGFVTNVETENRYNDRSGKAGRIRLDYSPLPRWRFGAALSGTDIDDGGSFVYLPVDRAAYNALGITSRPVEKFENALSHEGFNKTGANHQSVEANYFGNSFNAAWTSARRENNALYSADYDRSPLALTIGVNPFRILEWNHEGRIQSSRESRFNWTVGYTYNTTLRQNRFYFDPLQGFPPGKVVFGDSDLTGSTNGVFGQGTVRLMDQKLGLTAGLRGDWIERELDRQASVFGAAQNVKVEDSIALPRFVVDYRPAESIMVYISASKGWTAGGLNPFATVPSQVEYLKQTSWTYEVGAKFHPVNGKIFGEVSAFHNKIADYQDLVFTSAFSSYLSNAEKATTRGIEATIGLKPIPDLELKAVGGLIEAIYNAYTSNVTTGVKLDGYRIHSVPRYTASYVAHYRFLRDLFVHGEAINVGYQWEYRSIAVAPDGYKVGSYVTYNLRGGYDNGRWGVQMFVENAADREYFSRTLFGSSGGYTGPMSVPGMARQVGVRASLRY